MEGSPYRDRETATDGGRVFSTTGSRPIVPPGASTTKKASVNIKIIQARMARKANGRPEFEPLSQTFVDVTDSTANVMYLTHIIKEKWGSMYVLVTNDGMRIEDGSGTQGRLLNLPQIFATSPLLWFLVIIDTQSSVSSSALVVTLHALSSLC